MSKPAVTLLSNKIKIIPGEKTEINISVQNLGTAPHFYYVSLQGVDRRWYSLAPENPVGVKPGLTAVVSISLQPPLISSGEANRYAAFLEVTPEGIETEKVTIPLELLIGAAPDFDIELTPKKRSGRTGRYTLTLKNRGARLTGYSLTCKDPLNACYCHLEEQNIEIQPGHTAKLCLRVEPKEKPLRGSVETYRFFVTVTPDGSLPYQAKRVSGELTYRPLFSTIPAFATVLGIIVVASVFNALSSDIKNLAESEPGITFTLKMNMDGNGTLSGYGIYKAGDQATIRAVPETQWEFVEWTGDIESVFDPLASTTEIIMNGNYAVTANFRLREITPHTVYNIRLSPESPNSLIYGEWVLIQFDYKMEFWYLSASGREIDILPDVHVLARPFSNGALTPGYLVRGYNFMHPTSKEGMVEFTVNSLLEKTQIDQIRFQITNADQSIILHEFFVPVDYTFKLDPSQDYN